MRKRTQAPIGANVAVYWQDTLLTNTFVDRVQPIMVACSGEADLIVEDDRFRDPWCVAEVHEDAVIAHHPDGERPVPAGEGTRFDVGALTFVVTAKAPVVAPSWRAPADWDAARVFAISSLFHAFFIVAAWVTPIPSPLHPLAMLKRMPNLHGVKYVEKPEPPKTKSALAGVRNSGRHKDPEGRFGKKDLPKHDAAPSKPGAPRVDADRRERDREFVLQQGLLGALSQLGTETAVSNVLGPGGIGVGINDAMGGLRGAGNTTAGGFGGLGSRGTESGGGGRSIGIGGIGFGDRNGRPGGANIDLGGGGRRTVEVVPKRVILSEGLKRHEVSRVIRRNIARFKFCYEKQLNANPNLSGKISVYFSIAPTGSVASSRIREDTVGGGKVAACVQRVMKSLRFPKPRGGGVVVVTYPFLFEST